MKFTTKKRTKLIKYADTRKNNSKKGKKKPINKQTNNKLKLVHKYIFTKVKTYKLCFLSFGRADLR